jgi:hypothetical protein
MDIDSMILPLLLPVISSVSLDAISAEAEQLAGREVGYTSFFRSFSTCPLIDASFRPLNRRLTNCH